MYIDKLNDLYLKDKKGKIKCMKYDSADKEGETMNGEGLLSFWKAGEWKLEKWKQNIHNPAEVQKGEENISTAFLRLRRRLKGFYKQNKTTTKTYKSQDPETQIKRKEKERKKKVQMRQKKEHK